MEVIGIDIGGTQIKGAIINQEGNILLEKKVDTNILEGRESITKGLVTLIQYLLRENYVIKAIGIGSAGRIDVETGKVVYATDNLPGWCGFQLKAFIEQQFNIPTIVDNDANVALVGEAWLGAGRGYANIIMLTLGTGVGGANYFNHKLQHGAHYHASEWGHVILYPNGRECNCGQRGCIEQYLSGTTLVNNAKELGFNVRHGKEVFDLINKGEHQLKDMLDTYLNDLTTVIHNINLSYDPERIIIGGGVVDSKDHFWPQLINKVNQNPQISSDVVSAKLGNKAGMVGSAKLAFDMIKEV